MVGSTSYYKIKRAAKTLGWKAGVPGAIAGAIAGGIYHALDVITGYPMFNDIDAVQAGTLFGLATAGIATAYQAWKHVIKDKDAKLHYTIKPTDSAGDLNELLEGIVANPNNKSILSKQSGSGTTATTISYVDAFKNFAQDMLAVYASDTIMPLTEKGVAVGGTDATTNPLWYEETPVAVGVAPVRTPSKQTQGCARKVEIGLKKDENGQIAYVKTWTKKPDGIFFSQQINYEKFELKDNGEYKLLEQVI